MDKIRIVLAEDHTLMREGIRGIIQGQTDMEIAGEAANGEEAIEVVARTKPDVVLMDVAMPLVNGIEATRRIKEACPSASILVLTALDSEEIIFALVEAGAAGFLLKNVRGHELVNCIRAVHDGECVLHPAVAEKVFSRLTTLSPRSRPTTDRVLSERELELLRLSSGGSTSKEIAEKLCLGARTVQTHWRNIFNKLGVGSRTEAIMVGLRNGWIVLDGDDSKK